MDAKNIGIGLVGSGMGTLVLRVNNEADSRLMVRGIYDPDKMRRQQRYDVGKSTKDLADEFNVDFVTEDFDELLKRKDIKCIAIFSPCPCHYEQIKASLQAGKHVIVTKPMVVSMEQAREIVALVESTGLKCLVAQSMRWNGMFVGIHDLLEEGRLGRVIFAEAYYAHDMRKVFDVSPWRYQMPQDLMYGGVCHPADLLRWYVGEADEVFAYGINGGMDKRYPAKKENNFIISIKYRNGIIGRVLGAYDLVHPPNLWRQAFHGVGVGLYGSKGSLFNDRVVYDYYPQGKQPVEEDVVPKKRHCDHAGEILAMLRHFEGCIVNDEKPLVNQRDGAQIIAICSACWESIRSGKPVKVSREFDG